MYNFEKLFEVIDSKREEYLKFIREVVEIESPTSSKEGVDAVGRYFIEKAKKHNWKIEIFPQKIAGDVVVITMNPEIDNKPFCLSGHMDTVHPVGLFGDPCVRVEGNKMIGPGITDCKGGCVNAFWAMDALEQTGYKDRPVMLLLQSDEETSSRESNKATVNYIVERSKNAVGFFNLEGCLVEDAATVERKGIAKFEFTVRGESAHASKCFLGASAITEAAYKIIELERYKDPDGITFSCGTMQGGTVTNTVPDKCVFTLDTRFNNKEQYEEIKKFVEKTAKESHIKNTTCEVKEVSVRESMSRSELNYKFLDRVNEALKKAGLGELKGIKGTGGSDAAYVSLAGIPVIDSVGAPGGKVHNPEEYMEIEKFPLSTKRIAAAIADI